MKIQTITTVCAIAGIVSLAGCGGGGGRAAAAKSSPTGKTLTTLQATAPLRNARMALVISGLGLKATTRALTMRMGSRAAMLLKAAQTHTRSTTSGYDQDTQLYYAITNNSDGSGIEYLFTDPQHTAAAGSFTWGVPRWANGVPNAFPAVYHIVYSITAGPFAGDHGTLDITVNDALGHNGAIHILNLNKQGEHADCQENVASDVINILVQIAFPDGSSCSGSSSEGDDGSVDGDYTFSDGDQESVNMQPDGAGNETLTSPNGTDQATGDFNSEGNVDIQYDDGSSTSVDVDTAPEDDSGDDSGDGSGDDSGDNSSIVIRRP